MRHLTAAALLPFLIALAAPALAQTGPRRPQPAGTLPRFFIDAGVGTDVSNGAISYQVAFPLFAETGRIDTSLDPGRRFRIEVGGGMRLWKRVGIALAFVRSRADGTLESDISLPHPFRFDRRQSATGTASASQSTRDLHIQALFSLFTSDVWHVAVSGGPSVSWLDQELSADRLRIEYVFPFEAIAVSERADGRTSGRGDGGHIAVGVTRRLGRRLGLEGRLRWSRTTVALEDRDGHRVTIDTGGPHASAGIRLAF